MTKPVIHVSDAEATNDFGALLKHVRAGTEVIIEHDTLPVAVLRPPTETSPQAETASPSTENGHTSAPAISADASRGNEKLQSLKALHFPPETKAKRVRRSLEALARAPKISLSREDWAHIDQLSEYDDE